MAPAQADKEATVAQASAPAAAAAAVRAPSVQRQVDRTAEMAEQEQHHRSPEAALRMLAAVEAPVTVVAAMEVGAPEVAGPVKTVLVLLRQALRILAVVAVVAELGWLARQEDLA